MTYPKMFLILTVGTLGGIIWILFLSPRDIPWSSRINMTMGIVGLLLLLATLGMFCAWIGEAHT